MKNGEFIDENLKRTETYVVCISIYRLAIERRHGTRPYISIRKYKIFDRMHTGRIEVNHLSISHAMCNVRSVPQAVNPSDAAKPRRELLARRPAAPAAAIRELRDPLGS